jgi:acetate kinase
MHVLILNGGSSSLKYHLFDMEQERTVFEGAVSNLGLDGCRHTHTDRNASTTTETIHADDHHRAFEAMLSAMGARSGVDESTVRVVGHRVVHGAERFKSPAVIDDTVEEAIDEAAPLAPLHNPVNLEIIRLARRRIPHATHVAVFDTSFHTTMPDHAAIYGIPYEYYHDERLRRYGFHGNSHEYVAGLTARFLERPARRLKVITCHLGNGASVCAIDRGESIDTSMGLTPLEGLLMGTRAGDLDPALLTYLGREKGMGWEEIDHLLNRESGLLGVSGVSSDMQEVEKAAEEGDLRALLAIKLFCYRVKKYIGSYMLALGWVNAIVFTGGIGQNSPGIRWRVLQDCEKFGIGISEEKNRRCRVERGRPVYDISDRSSHAHILVAATNEELMMARKCLQAIDYDRTALTDSPATGRLIPIGISAHHVHLCREDVEALFGEGHRLTPAKPLAQPEQFACVEKIDLVGPRGTVEGVRILGPERSRTQVEISRTEEFKLGIDAPIRESGDLEGSPGLTLVGPEGTVALAQGVICAKRHIHMPPDEAKLFDVENGDTVMVRTTGPGRDLIFGDVVVRVSDRYELEMHLDTDEANAAELTPDAMGELLAIQARRGE